MPNLWICPKHKECKDNNRKYYGNDVMHNRCAAHPEDSRCSYTNFGDACPVCIPYVREFKVGDKVRVLSRTLCGNSSITYSLEDCGVRIGDIVKIMSTRTCSHCKAKAYDISISGYTFHEQDLELITEEADMDKPKYKAIRNLCASEFYKDGDITCPEFADNLIGLLRELQPKTLHAVINIHDLMVWAEQDPKRIKWLIEKGYIEKVQSKMDKWEDDCPIYVGDIRPEVIEWAKRMPKED